MKCLLFLIYISLFLSNVASLRLQVQPTTIAGSPSLVLWQREPTDPVDLCFDLRFVQNNFDVGLAIANVTPAATDQFGTVSVVFPGAGQYVLTAVVGSPRHIQIGTSNVVEVIQISTSSPAPSSTTDAPSTTNNPTPPSITATTPLPASDNPTSAPPSPVTSTSTSSSTPTVVPSAAARRGPNVPVIAGSIVGAIVLLGLLATLVVFITRKREKIKKRFTFHKDMMVQRRQSRHPSIPVSAPATTVPPPYPFTAAGGLEAQTPARPESNVQGLHSAALPPSSRPLGTGHIVPSPRGPRGPAIKRTEQTVVTSTPPALDHVPSRTRRQRELTERITQLREQIGEMHRIARPDATQRAVMDDMQRQMVWLRDQENSAWALEQTNNPPPGYARYMTP